MAFRQARKLQSIKFSSSLTSIGNAAFQYCSSLAELVLPDNITNLGNSTFSYCYGLKDVSIMGNIVKFGDSTFYECQSIENIYINSNTSPNLGTNNYIFYNAGIEGKGITVTISENGYIPEGLFVPFEEYNYPQIVKIIVEEGATSVNYFKAINFLPCLVKIEVAETVEYINPTAFHNSPWWEAQPEEPVYIDGVCYACKVCAPADAVQENRVEPTCTQTGSYDLVVYCYGCHGELSRETIVLNALGHTAGADADCENAQQCAVCGAQLEKPIGHNGGEAVSENRVEPTCTEKGSYESVVYCRACNKELSRETVSINALGHKAASAVEENKVEPTCTKKGSYDTVVYCSVCDDEFSREANTINALGHKAGAAATCTTAQKCTVCHVVLVEALGHKAGAAATCTTAQKCTVCQVVLVAAFGHKAGAAATCTTAQKCTVCQVVLVAAFVHKAGTAATCTTVQICTVCNVELVVALGHDYSGENTCTRCADYKDKGVAFTFDGTTNSYSITDYTGSESEVIIPSTYNGYPVTSIGSSAFYGCSSLTNINVPDGVTSIGDYAFYGCRQLTIYCEVAEQPSGWSHYWNPSDRPIVWGYKVQE